MLAMLCYGVSRVLTQLAIKHAPTSSRVRCTLLDPSSRAAFPLAFCAGPQLDKDGRPLSKAVNMCILPSDAELAAREDTRAYLHALTTNNSTDLRVAANNPSAPFNPLPSCPLQQGCKARPASWTPFTVISGANMCNGWVASAAKWPDWNMLPPGALSTCLT